MTMKGKDISSNARRIITIDEHGNIVIPNGEIWMGEFEIADLVWRVRTYHPHAWSRRYTRDGLLHPLHGREEHQGGRRVAGLMRTALKWS